MLTNRRNSSTFVACVVFLLSLWPALPATAQGVLKVDTLFRSYAPDVVRYEVIGVHDDTVLIRGRNIANLPNGVPTFMVHVSKDGGQTFDSLQSLDGSRNDAPLRGLRRVVRLIGQTTPVTYVAHDGVNFTEQRVADYLDVEYAQGYFLHPTHPDTSFLLVRSGSDRYGNYREWMFYRFNDNDQWTNLYVPFPKIGLHRAITLEFDYGRPNRIYATVDSETSYGGLADHLGPKWLYYVTDDWGQTWTELEQHPLGADACNGNTSCHVRIGLPMIDQYIARVGMGPKNTMTPIINNYLTGTVDSTMGVSLSNLLSLFTNSGNGEMRNLDFRSTQVLHPDCPDGLITFLHYDIFLENQWRKQYTILFSSNTGAAWKALSNVFGALSEGDRSYHAEYIGYSCSEVTAYVAYSRHRSVPPNAEFVYETGIIRARLGNSTTSVGEQTLESILVHLWPNPTSEFVTVSTSNGYLNKNTGVEFYDALGCPCGYMTNLISTTENSYTIDVRKLAVGTYRVTTVLEGKIMSVPLIVQR